MSPKSWDKEEAWATAYSVLSGEGLDNAQARRAMATIEDLRAQRNSLVESLEVMLRVFGDLATGPRGKAMIDTATAAVVAAKVSRT